MKTSIMTILLVLVLMIFYPAFKRGVNDLYWDVHYILTTGW